MRMQMKEKLCEMAIDELLVKNVLLYKKKKKKKSLVNRVMYCVSSMDSSSELWHMAK